jgi:hypothetical protein
VIVQQLVMLLADQTSIERRPQKLFIVEHSHLLNCEFDMEDYRVIKVYRTLAAAPFLYSISAKLRTQGD